MPESFSDDLKDLLTKMMTVGPKNRISAQEIIRHTWMTKNIHECNGHDDHHHEHSELIVNNLK
tara:strand:- start:538 stop:726 length:189 start_codon:yes stop_codon:yes gene_type:complete